MRKKKVGGQTKGRRIKPGTLDTEEIIATVGHIPDRDQVFHSIEAAEPRGPWIGGTDEDRMKGVQDEDEGDTGVVSDPAYEREGDSRVLRSLLGDTSVEEHMSPAGREGVGGSNDPRGIQHLSLAELRKRARALSVPGRSKMTKTQLSAAVHDAF